MTAIPAQAGIQPRIRWAPVATGVAALLAFLLLLLSASPAFAQTFPRLTGRVVDNANLLDPQQEAALTTRLEGLEKQSGRQLVVATVPSLEGRPIEDYGYRLGRTWGIGREGEDDGVILLVAPNERKVRIETGYGARVFLTDAVSSVIIRNSILPRFKAGDYPGGISEGVDAISEQMVLPPAEAQRRAQEIGAQEAQRQQQRSSSGGGMSSLFFWVIIFFFIVLPMLRGLGGGRRYKSGKRRHSGGVDPLVILWGMDALSRGSRGGGGWGGGGGFGGGFGGGGGFSGGGGSFGGGGASGGW